MAAINRQRKRLLTRLKFTRLINTLRAEITRDFIGITRRNIEWPKPGETMYEDEYMVLTLDKVHDDGSMEVTGRACLFEIRGHKTEYGGVIHGHG